MMLPKTKKIKTRNSCYKTHYVVFLAQHMYIIPKRLYMFEVRELKNKSNLLLDKKTKHVCLEPRSVFKNEFSAVGQLNNAALKITARSIQRKDYGALTLCPVWLKGSYPGAPPFP